MRVELWKHWGILSGVCGHLFIHGTIAIQMHLYRVSKALQRLQIWAKDELSFCHFY